MLVTIKDETFSGGILNEILLSFKEEEVTIKEIITERVKHEVEEYNNTSPEYFKGLIEPSEAGKTLNGFKLKKLKKIDSEKQVYVALDAFLKNAYFLLIDNIQSESLEQKVKLSENTEISFVKLTPLVGG
jgi:hypothetical protein